MCLGSLSLQKPWSSFHDLCAAHLSSFLKQDTPRVRRLLRDPCGFSFPPPSPCFPSLFTNSFASGPHFLSWNPWFDRVGLCPRLPMEPTWHWVSSNPHPVCQVVHISWCDNQVAWLFRDQWGQLPTSRRELQPKAIGLPGSGSVQGPPFLQWERAAILEIALDLGL